MKYLYIYIINPLRSSDGITVSKLGLNMSCTRISFLHFPFSELDRVEDLDVSLADASKPTVVWDPAVNGEVFLGRLLKGAGKSAENTFIGVSFPLLGERLRSQFSYFREQCGGSHKEEEKYTTYRIYRLATQSNIL